MPEEIDHIEELQKRLYARDPDSIPKRSVGILHPEKQNVTSTWGETSLPKDKTKPPRSTIGFRRFFIFSLIFFLIGAGLAAFSVFKGAVTLSSKNVELSIVGNSFVAGGEELPIQVEIANKNATDLIDARLILEYPRGAVDESGGEATRLTQELGTIGSGKSKSVGFSTVLYGEQGLARTISATLSYHLEGSTAVFEKKDSFSVMISSSPIELTIDGPSVTASDQPFTLTLRTLFTGDQSIENGIVRVEYPSGFTFLSSAPTPSAAQNVWNVGTLEKGKEQIVTIRGKLSGIEGDEKAFRVYLGTPLSDTDNRIAVAYNSTLHSVTIEQPFIAAEISVEGQTGDVASLPIGSTISGAIKWQNMTGQPIVNPAFTVEFSGEGVDLSSVKVIDGYYDELLRTLTWTGTSSEALSTIEPGESGTLLFSLSPKSEAARQDVDLALSIEGTVQQDGQNLDKAIGDIDELIVRYAARIQFAANALYSIGSIKNTGPFPPKANEETSYTLSWTIRPTDNPLSNIIVTATLPSNVTWGGVIFPQAEALSYNPDTREVRWNVGVLPRATATPLSKTVSFQVKVKPTASQVGSELVLLSETTISANDAVANVPLEGIRPGLSTRLTTDPAYSPGEEKVLP